MRLSREEYDEYLRSPEWQERRQKALAFSGHRCQMNREHTTQLQVHHNTYERLGHERPSDLIVLCDTCHAKHEGKLARYEPEVEPEGAVPAQSPPVVSRSIYDLRRRSVTTTGDPVIDGYLAGLAPRGQQDAGGGGVTGDRA
jgi:hypothetical protein